MGDEDEDDASSDEDGNTNETISGVELLLQLPPTTQAAERTATCTRRQCDLERLASSGGNLTLVVHGPESRNQGSDAENTDNATVGGKKGLTGNNSHDVMLKGSWDDHHHWNPRRRNWDRRRRGHWHERRRRSHGGHDCHGHGYWHCDNCHGHCHWHCWCH